MEEVMKKSSIGMVLICSVYVLCIILYLLATTIALLGTFPVVYVTMRHKILGMVSFIVWILIIMSILNRYRWGWYLILFYAVFSAGYPIMYHFLRPARLPYYPILTFVTVVIPVAIIAYLLRRKEYFNA